MNDRQSMLKWHLDHHALPYQLQYGREQKPDDPLLLECVKGAYPPGELANYDDESLRIFLKGLSWLWMIEYDAEVCGSLDEWHRRLIISTLQCLQMRVELDRRKAEGRSVEMLKMPPEDIVE